MSIYSTRFNGGIMRTVYHCVTGNWLPHSKRLFDSLDEVKSHIDKVLSMCKDGVGIHEKLYSVRVTMIDADEVKSYKEIFLENPEITYETKRRKIRKPPARRTIVLDTPALQAPT